MALVLKGDFIGFTFNGKHSSSLGIIRTSSSNRYSDDLVPSIADTLIDLNNDGMEFSGAKYKSRTFSLPFAFQDLSEIQLKELRSFICDSTVHPLIFDELPYKTFYAKATGMATVKHICYSIGGMRHYNGEGSFNFTCYFPYGLSRYNYTEDYTIDNIPEWAPIDQDEESALSGSIGDKYTNVAKIQYDFDKTTEAYDMITASLTGILDQFTPWLEDLSLLKDVADITDMGNQKILIGNIYAHDYVNYNAWIESSDIKSAINYGKYYNNNYKVYNSGDLDMPFRMWFKLPINNEEEINFKLTCNNKVFEVKHLRNLNVTKDVYCVLDTGNATISGYSLQNQPTGVLYNEFITTDDFVTIGCGEQNINVEGALPSQIEFNYLYL